MIQRPSPVNQTDPKTFHERTPGMFGHPWLTEGVVGQVVNCESTLDVSKCWSGSSWANTGPVDFLRQSWSSSWIFIDLVSKNICKHATPNEKYLDTIEIPKPAREQKTHQNTTSLDPTENNCKQSFKFSAVKPAKSIWQHNKTQIQSNPAHNHWNPQKQPQTA